MESPSSENEFKEGVKESHSKAHCPLAIPASFRLLQTIIMVPTLGSLDLNFLISQPGFLHQTVPKLAPSHSPVSLPMSLVKAFAPHANNATYPKSLYHLLGFICFVARI